MIIQFRTTGSEAEGRYSFWITPAPEDTSRAFLGILFSLNKGNENIQSFRADSEADLIKDLKEWLWMSMGLRISELIDAGNPKSLPLEAQH
jgi:hypothetical protein